MAAALGTGSLSIGAHAVHLAAPAAAAGAGSRPAAAFHLAVPAAARCQRRRTCVPAPTHLRSRGRGEVTVRCGGGAGQTSETQARRREFLLRLPLLLPLAWAVLGADEEGASASDRGQVLRVQAPSPSLAYDMVIVMRAAGSLR